MPNTPDLSHFKVEAAQWDDNEDHKRTQQQALQAILEAKLLNEDDHLLDFGCGPGGFTSAMAQHVRSAVGIDATSEMIEVAHRARANVNNVKFYCLELSTEIDLTKMGAPFDVIVSLLVLHHIPDVAHKLELLRRCLRPGGRLVVLDLLLTEHSRDFHPEEKHASVVEHGFSAERIRMQFTQAGLEKVDVNPHVFIMRKSEHGGAEHGHGHGHGLHSPSKKLEHPMFMAVGYAPPLP